MSGANNWMSNGVGGLYGAANSGGNAGGPGPYRDNLDYARQGFPGRTPEAEYPDGYLNTTNSRYNDRLLNKIGSMNRRSYTRGVHKGSRIDPGDYLWPANWNPQRGIQFEARGMKTPLTEDTMPRLSEKNLNMPPTVAQGPAPRRRTQLGPLAPSWS